MSKPKKPEKVWVQFDANHFPEGVTMLLTEAKDWARACVDGRYIQVYELPRSSK